jgi:hypothetical protein
MDEEEHSLFEFAAGKWFSTGIFTQDLEAGRRDCIVQLLLLLARLIS